MFIAFHAINSTFLRCFSITLRYVVSCISMEVANAPIRGGIRFSNSGFIGERILAETLAIWCSVGIISWSNYGF